MMRSADMNRFRAACLIAALLLFAVCALAFPANAAADDAGAHKPASEEQLNDLGEDNLINVQQTPDSSFLYDVAIADLCTSSISAQNKTVQVKGEAVGYALRAEQNPGMYWITLNAVKGEKEGSLSVLVTEEQLKVIDTYGEYGKCGTILNVKGTFHVACPSHEGLMDIHADSVTALTPGSATPDTLNILYFLPGLMLCLVALALFLAYRSFAEGER